MKLRDCLRSGVHKFMVVDGFGQLLFCGRDSDPGSSSCLRRHLGKEVASTAHSGTYLLVTLNS